MLNLITGRAGAGKTNFIMSEIRRRMKTCETGMYLIVPEQYSHNAERQLCAVCGDGLSLHAEVLSFTRLCNNVFEELGELNAKILDKSGQILVMHRALESVAPSLKVYGIKRLRTDITENLLETIKELKSLNITPQTLEQAATKASDPLAGKLHDLALIFEAYNALLETHGGDLGERLSLLVDMIGESSVGTHGHIYFDGFNDFTAQEMSVIEELLRKKADVTVSITCNPDGDCEQFEIPRMTVAELKRLAKQVGTAFKLELMEVASSSSTTHTELLFLENHIFDERPPKYAEKSEAISIYETPTRYAECEGAASVIMNLIKSGYRWRDIAVMSRDWDEYASLCENAFERYKVPYFSSGKADILGKPPMALIDAALEIAASGWEYKTVLRYLKLGLIDISTEKCALLENYVIKWQIRGSLWTREWKMPPSGYGRGIEDDDKLLSELNKIREGITCPLIKLSNEIKGESLAADKLRKLYAFLTEINLSARLTDKAKELDSRGEMRMADEYTQLWNIIVNTMDRMFDILGDKYQSPTDFRKLLMLAFSQNDVGVIPVSLDRVALGSMQMSRRRGIKCLILLGATDDKMPMLTKRSGALSDNERAELRKLGTDIPAGFEERYCREMNMLYLTLTQPAEKLMVTYSTESGSRPSFIVKNLCTMFDIDAGNFKDNKQSPTEYFMRDSLTKDVAAQLYGEKLSVSATRADSYYSCSYKHFLSHGLRLEPQLLAEFDAMTAGNFIHYVLDGVLREIKGGAGLKKTDAEACKILTERYIEKYVKEVLLDFEGKNVRFIKLFKRYQADTEYVVSDMITELKNSDFGPLDLELSMRELSDSQTGYIDRVDGFEHDGKMFLRVVDYKTRKKAYSFELSDVLHGRNMQMLLYLYALIKYGRLRYGKEIEPAGVLYLPARDVVLTVSKNATDEDINKKRDAEMRRSGLVLGEEAIIEAMEAGESKKYLPISKGKSCEPSGDSYASREQFGILLRHVAGMIANAEDEILSGAAECRPYYKNENENACSFCVYNSVCGFDEEMGDKYSFVRKLSNDEIWKTLKSSGL